MPVKKPTSSTLADSPLQTGLAAVCDRQCRLLILGSFPGVASLQAAQYYAHPRNQFWRLVGISCGLELVGLHYAQRLAALRQAHLGLWDVYSHCRRQGSLDSAIRDAQINDMAALRQRLPQLRAVAHNGGESARAMPQVQAALQVPAFKLPSSSPAHASWSFERKLQAWQQVFDQAGVGRDTAISCTADGASGPASAAKPKTPLSASKQPSNSR